MYGKGTLVLTRAYAHEAQVRRVGHSQPVDEGTWKGTYGGMVNRYALRAPRVSNGVVAHWSLGIRYASASQRMMSFDPIFE